LTFPFIMLSEIEGSQKPNLDKNEYR